MVDEEYIVRVFYNPAKPKWKEATEKVFRELTERSLDFSAALSHVSNDLGAVRVFIDHRNCSTGYSPLGGQESELEEALDNLARLSASKS